MSKLIYLVLIFVVILMLYFNKTTIPFPPTLLINLDKRTDRMEEINTEFKDWPVPVERVSAVEHKPGWKGCSASHLKCMRIAKERNYPWVVILEDDCILTPNALRRFQSILPFLWATRDRWDVFLGGPTYLGSHVRISHNPNIHQVYGLKTHFCLLNQNSYNRVLNDHPPTLEDYKVQIDVFYAEKYRLWTMPPFIARQRPSESSIEDKFEDSTAAFEEAEQKLQGVVRPGRPGDKFAQQRSTWTQ